MRGWLCPRTTHMRIDGGNKTGDCTIATNLSPQQNQKTNFCTTHTFNYLYVTQMSISNDSLRIYFLLQRRWGIRTSITEVLHFPPGRYTKTQIAGCSHRRRLWLRTRYPFTLLGRKWHNFVLIFCPRVLSS